MQNHQGGSSGVSCCPSFSSYSTGHLAETAARVRQEEEEGHKNGLELEQTTAQSNRQNQDNDDDDDFEFVLVRANPDEDDSMSFFNGNGEFYPVFPLFNRDLLMDHDQNQNQNQNQNQQRQRRDFDGDVASPNGFSLEKLFIHDLDPPSSSSSSEADELEGVPQGTYCVWTPKSRASPSPSPGRCKKSNSTGSSSKPRQGWRWRDLLRRCSSDGKKTLVFLDTNNNRYDGKLGKKKEEGKGEKGKTTVAVKTKAKEKVSPHEVFYVKSKALKEGDKRKSYLPYRQDLVGFFANVNGLSKPFPPF